MTTNIVLNNAIMGAISRRRAAIASKQSVGGARMTFADREPGRWPDDCMFIDTSWLSRLHPFKQDCRIEFYERDHYYKVDGERYPISVTGMIGAPHKPFLRWQIIRNLREFTRRKWGGGDDASIAAAWHQNGAEASRLGTKMHAAIEVYLSAGVLSRDMEIRPEMQQFMDFKAKVLDARNIKCWRTEPIIFTEASTGIRLSGSVDFLGFDGKEFWIMDWKRPKDIKRTANGKNGYCLPPLDKYEQVDYVKYSTQLHTYRYIFERFYGIKIPKDNLYMVAFHASKPNFEFYKALDLEVEVVNMMDNFDYWLDQYHKKLNIILADEMSGSDAQTTFTEACALDECTQFL